MNIKDRLLELYKNKEISECNYKRYLMLIQTQTVGESKINTMYEEVEK